MKSASILNLVIILSLLISSCSVEKKRYSNGYYISKHPRSFNIGSNESESSIIPISTERDSTFKQVDKQFVENNILPQEKSVIERNSITTHSVASNFNDNLIKSNRIENDSNKDVEQNKKREILFRNKDVEGKQLPLADGGRRKMSTVLKLAIIFTGLGIIALIVGFFSWYFFFLATVTGTVTSPFYLTLLTYGLISFCLGLLLFITYWLSH